MQFFLLKFNSLDKKNQVEIREKSWRPMRNGEVSSGVGKC